MVCPSCGRENPADANFCGQCGTRLITERPCPSCGRPNPPDLRFCRSCGGPPDEVAETAGNGGVPPPLGEGRYVLESFLGEGGRKLVYLGHDTTLDRDVAVALVKTAGLDATGRTRVQREAQAMARLGDHPHVVTVYDIGDERGEPYIVSQYMEGGAVEDLLQQAPERRLDLDTVLTVAAGICAALEHAHRHGIVHRDLKPANVWLTADGTAKLGDFGLAFSLDGARVTRAGAIVGTAAYMAPEQALGHQPDAQSDLYSLGAMLYEMVTGRPPFVGDDVVSVISQHANSEPVAPSWHTPDVPEALERLILDLLEKSPDGRAQGAAEVRRRLEEVRARAAECVPPAPRGDDSSRVEALAEGVFVGRERE